MNLWSNSIVYVSILGRRHDCDGESHDYQCLSGGNLVKMWQVSLLHYIKLLLRVPVLSTRVRNIKCFRPVDRQQ